MSGTVERLREEFKDPELSEGYAESFLDSYIATQIKVLRERDGLSQQALAELIGTRQGVVSRIENVNYSKWNISTLKKLARAFRVRLKVSFETYGSLLSEVATFSRESLDREPRERDRLLNAPVIILQRRPRPTSRPSHRDKSRPRELTKLQDIRCYAERGIGNSTFLGPAARQNLASVVGQATTAEMVGQR